MSRSGLVAAVVCLFCLLASPTLAAPSLTGRPEPVRDAIGTFRNEHLAARALHAPGLAITPPAAVRMVLLRVDFPADTDPHTTGSGTWDDPAYAHQGDANYWVNKNATDLHSYYSEVSRGQFALTVAISPQIYTLPQQLAYYDDLSNQKLEALIRDAINQAQAAGDTAFLQKPEGIDSQVMVIVHAGPGEETDAYGDTQDDIWSLFYDFGAPVTFGAISLKEAIIMPQTGAQDDVMIDPLGVYAHEFGHFLGLPDLYPTNSFPQWGGVSTWCLMDAGAYSGEPIGSSPAWPSAWCRQYLGWETANAPLPTADLGSTTFVPVETEGTSGQRLVRLPLAPGQSSRYFLLENRQRLGFDAGLDGHGLLVWKIDENVISSNLALNSINNDRLRPGISLVEADGDASLLSYYGVADDGDPFPGSRANHQFTPDSTPVASTTNFGSGWVNLTTINEESVSHAITADVGLGPVDVTGLSTTVSASGVELTWSANADAAAYLVYRNGVEIASTAETSWFDADGTADTLYALGSIDAAGNTTIPRVLTTPNPPPAPNPAWADFGVNNSGCFIATAAFGSYEAPAVQTLRVFRDRLLLTNAPGRAFVSLYYRVSPPIAARIAASPTLRGVVRILLLPPIALAAISVAVSELPMSILLLSGMLTGILFVRLQHRLKPSAKITFHPWT